MYKIHSYKSQGFFFSLDLPCDSPVVLNQTGLEPPFIINMLKANMLPKMLTLYPIIPGCQEHTDGHLHLQHTDGHLHLPISKSSVLLRKLLVVSGSRVLILDLKYC